MVTPIKRALAVCLAWTFIVPAHAAVLQIVKGAHSSGKPYISCEIDGAKERCFLDTGSAMTLVASERFEGYTNIGEFQFKSASGIAQQTETIQIGALQIDDVVFSNLRIGRAEFEDAENTLGIDILGQKPFSLSFKPKAILELDAKRVEEPLTTLEMPGHGLLSIPVSVGDSEIRGLWDTGASLTFVDQTFIQAHPHEFKATKDYMNGVDGAGHKMLVQVFRAGRIVVGNRVFSDVHVVGGDLSLLRENVSKEIQAVIGFNVIRRANWFFDRKLRLWKCWNEPGEKKDFKGSPR